MTPLPLTVSCFSKIQIGFNFLVPAHLGCPGQRACVTHTHTFNGPVSGTTRVSRIQVCTLLQTDNHTSTPPLSSLQAGCPSCRPTNSVKALKALICCQCLHNVQSRIYASVSLSHHGPQQHAYSCCILQCIDAAGLNNSKE